MESHSTHSNGGRRVTQAQRERHYALVRRNFEAASTEFGIEGAMAHAWLHSAMIGIQSLVAELKLAVALRVGTPVQARR